MSTAWTLIRLGALLLLWGLGGVVGWWSARQEPLDAPLPLAVAPRPSRLPAALLDDPAKADSSTQLQRLDLFALQRNQAAAPQSGPSPPDQAGSTQIEWRFAALAVNPGRGERTLVITATGQAPLVLKEGDRLPNGERIRTLRRDQIELQDRRGRRRTIQLIEP